MPSCGSNAKIWSAATTHPHVWLAAYLDSGNPDLRLNQLHMSRAAEAAILVEEWRRLAPPPLGHRFFLQRAGLVLWPRALAQCTPKKASTLQKGNPLTPKLGVAQIRTAHESTMSLAKAGLNVSGYWRRGTFNGNLAYVHIGAHKRTATPAPRTKQTKVIDPKTHSVVQNCKLPKPKDALKAAQAKPKPELTRKAVDVD